MDGRGGSPGKPKSRAGKPTATICTRRSPLAPVGDENTSYNIHRKSVTRICILHMKNIYRSQTPQRIWRCA